MAFIWADQALGKRTGQDPDPSMAWVSPTEAFGVKSSSGCTHVEMVGELSLFT